MNKLFQFFQDNDGQLSSTRLFKFIVVICTATDWLHAIFTVGHWNPDWSVVGMVLGVLGFSIGQKSVEVKNGVNKKKE